MKKGLIRSVLAVVAMMTWMGSLSAQTLADAQTAYNSSLSKMTENPAEAIELLNACLDLCKSVGEEADDVKALAELNLTKAYVNLGKKYATAKDFGKAVETFGIALQKGKQYKNDDVVKASSEALAQIHTQNGFNLYKEKKMEEAMTEVKKALEYSPNYGTGWLIKCYVAKDMGDDEAFTETLNKGLEACVTTNDNRNRTSIQKLGRDYFLQQGSKAVTANKMEEAITALEKSISYDGSNKDAYYYYAVALSGVKKFQEAADASNKGLELETGEADKKARFYYTLGTALKGLGDNAGACSAFKNALFGPFEEGAKYEIEHELKCN